MIFAGQSRDQLRETYRAAWRRYKQQHTLSPREEEMLAMAGEVTRIPRTVFGMLNDADLTFGTIRDEKGEEVEITHGRYSLFLESNDRRVRRDTWLALYQSYAAHKNTFASLLSGAVKRDIFFARDRGYPSALHAALHPANIPIDVYHTLVPTVPHLAPLALDAAWVHELQGLVVDAALELRGPDGAVRVVAVPSQALMQPEFADVAAGVRSALLRDDWIRY